MTTTRSMRILVVDDEEIVRKSFSRVLADDGFEVETAENGEAAIGILAERSFDLVVTDLRMPKVDGRVLLRHVKAHFADTEVVLLTGHGTIESAVAAMQEGAYN